MDRGRVSKDRVRSVAAVAWLALLGGPALAQVPTEVDAGASARANVPAAAAGEWEYSLGAALISTPRFVGSRKTRTLVVPSFEIKYDDWFFIDPIKGVGVERKVVDGLTVDASIAVDLASRRRKDDARLEGFDNIVEAPALRFALDYVLGDAFVSASVATRIGQHNGRGTLFDTDVGYNIVTSKRALVGVGLNVKGMDTTYARHFFGVSSRESAASGLPVFRAEGGLQSFGPFVQAVVPFGDRWTLFARVAGSRLRGDAAASPITVRRTQGFALATLTRAF